MAKRTVELVCKVTSGTAWLMCPVCRGEKLLKLLNDTRAQYLPLFCRQCKHESVVDIGPGNGPQSPPRAWLSDG